MMVSGCCNIQHPQERYNNLKINYDESFCKGEVKRLSKALRATTDYWIGDFKRTTPKVSVDVLYANDFKCGETDAIGCYLHAQRKIKLVSGTQLTLPAFYHELCHAAFATHDVEHIHEKWEEWDEREDEIQKLLD